MELSKEELKDWLKLAIASSVSVVVLSSSIIDLSTNITSPVRLLEVMERDPAIFEGGKYRVEAATNEESGNDLEIVYSNYVCAFTLQVTLTNGPVTGGMSPLLSALSGFEYIRRIKKEDYGYLGYVLIRVPESAQELESLQESLKKFAIMYAFPDGTNTFNMNNVRFGNGIGSRA